MNDRGAKPGRGATAGQGATAGRAARAGVRGAAGTRHGDAPVRQPGIDLVALRARLRDVVAPVVEAAGYDLEDLVVSRAGRRHLVRIAIDADGGVSLDAVAEVSREISAALDAAENAGGDLVTGEYVLEVGSPGVDRPLSQARHWRRNIGRMVAVRAAGQPLTGRVVAADERTVVLELDQGQREFALADLGPGKVQIEFSKLDELDDDDLDDEREEDEE